MAIMMTRPSRSWIHLVGKGVEGEAIRRSGQAENDLQK
jgi:hypothetical protein